MFYARTSGKAVASLVFGICGLLIFTVVFSVLAIVFSVLARSEIKRSGGGVQGDGLAIAGLVLGIIGMVASVIIFAIAVPAYLGIEENAQMSTCKSNQRTIDGVIEQFKYVEGRYPESIEELVEKGHLKKELKCPEYGAYRWVPGDPPHTECEDASHNLDSW